MNRSFLFSLSDLSHLFSVWHYFCFRWQSDSFSLLAAYESNNRPLGWSFYRPSNESASWQLLKTIRKWYELIGFLSNWKCHKIFWFNTDEQANVNATSRRVSYRVTYSVIQSCDPWLCSNPAGYLESTDSSLEDIAQRFTSRAHITYSPMLLSLLHLFEKNSFQKMIFNHNAASTVLMDSETVGLGAEQIMLTIF